MSILAFVQLMVYLVGLMGKFMINRIKNMLIYNFKELVIFQIVFKITSFLIFAPLFLNIFNIIMKITGYEYLTFENMVGFILNPLVEFMLILLILFMMVYTFFDLSTVIIILDASYQEKKIDIKEVLTISTRKSLEVFKAKNIALAFMILFLIPFLNIGIASGFISSIKIPEFIMDYINNNLLFMFIFWLIFGLLTVILLRWLYAIHYYILENCDFKEARKRSINLIKGSRINDLSKLIVVQGIVYGIYLIFLFIGIALIYFIYKLLQKIMIIGSVFITIIGIFLALSLIIFAALSMPLSYAVMSIMFYRHKEKNQELIKHINFNKQRRVIITKKKWQHIKATLIVVVVITGSIFTYNVATNRYNFNIEYIKNIEITAHRGDSLNYPENTILAFDSAVNKDADWIELDVQLTKDKEIVVCHDANLKRVAGVDKNIYDLSYEELSQINIKNNNDDTNVKIPLLSDVFRWGLFNNVSFNVELKPYDDDLTLVKKVIELVKKYYLEDRVTLSSNKYSILEEIKNVDDKVSTAYIMSLAYGDISKLDKADNFSIEASSINKDLVKKLHNDGKEVFAWTVNARDSINKMLDLNVDNIITDDVEYAKKLLFESKSSNLVFVYLKMIEKIFK